MSMKQPTGSDRDAVERETALVRVHARGTDVAALVALSAQVGARVLDAVGSALIIEITDAPDRVSSFIDRLRPFGMLDLARSGPVVLPRSAPPAASRPAAPTGRARPGASTWASYVMPAPPAPFTSQADGASDDVVAA
jgi:hypothetical protein